MYWNKRIAILVSALVIAAVGTGILAFLRRPSLESLSGLSGPAEISVVATEGKSDWTDYAIGSDTRLAILLTDDDSSWLGVTEGLKTIGIPFRITRDVETAVRHKVVMVYPAISGQLLDADSLGILEQHVEMGGTLIATQVLGGGLQGVFGFDQIEQSRSHSEIRFTGSDPTLSFIDQPEEQTVRIGNPEDETQRIGAQSFLGASTVLASYEDGSAALVTKTSDQGGHAYALGFDLGFFILKATNGRTGGASRNYGNAYEPSVDTWLRWIKSVYVQEEPHAITLHTVPEARDLAVVISFDVDYTHSMSNLEAYTNLLMEKGLLGTFFVQTKYFDDYNDKAFFNDRTLPILSRVAGSGMEIGSHTVAHPSAFSDIPLGDGEERFPDYQPRVLNRARVWSATILGELRVSKFLLEHFMETDVVSFRPGYLATPERLPEALEASGYKYASTATSGHVLTHLPFRMNFSRGYADTTSIFQFPIAIEDEIPPHMNLRLDSAIELAEQLSDYGGSFVMLIHPNVTGEKLEFLNAIIPVLEPHSWFGTLQQYGDWWVMRDGVSVDTSSTEAGIVVTVNSEVPIYGLRLDLDSAWRPQTALPAGMTFSSGALYIGEAGTEVSVDFLISSETP